MSLHHLANHLAAQGRGVDSVLVHMSPGEVKNLQGIARAHGGSLTVNPHTGLVEAGFLSSIMPAIEGAAVMAGGAAMGMPIDPGTAALIVGGVNGVAKGNLMQGIQAGMGAYGGAGLEQGAAANGMFDQSPQAVTNQVPQAAPIATPAASNTGFTPGVDAGTSLSEASAPSAVQNSFVPGVDAGTSLSEASSAPTAPKAYSLMDLVKDNPKYAMAAAAPGVMSLLSPNKTTPADQGAGMIRPYTFNYNPQASNGMVGNKPMIGTKYTPGQDTSERQWFQPTYTAGTPYTPVKGVDYAEGGPIEAMSNANAIGANTHYPQADIHHGAYSSPWQTPISENVLPGPGDVDVDPYTGEQKLAAGGMPDMGGIYAGEQSQYSPGGISGLMNYAQGGSTDLGSYSDGGRMLKGPGDGMSDSIPASIEGKQPARLADSEFVVPADVVSHLGNGSTDAGAKQLYKMMDRVRQARTGTKKQGKQINPSKFLPV
jgi:hypothetical protein